MKVGKINHSVLDLWDSMNYDIKRELESLEQYYCLEVYKELSNIIDDHKDLKRFTDCGVLLLVCSDFNCSSFGSRIEIIDLFRRHDIILEFKSDGIMLTKPLIFNPELNDTIFYPLSYDGISKCTSDLKYEILPEFSLILSRDSRYLSKTASTLLEKEFGTENFNVGRFYPNGVTINILGRPSIYIDFDRPSTYIDFDGARCSVSLYRSEFIDTSPSSFTTIDEWEKYLAELVSNFIV